MSIHIGGKKGNIAETVLLPGDPKRAKFIAENFLENVECYSEVRGMLGFTGTYQGKRVSVQGTGMGLPSIAIYVNELINEYGCQNLIRIGSAGAMQADLNLNDLVLAMSSSTDSNINQRIFKGDYAATASFELLKRAYDNGLEMGLGMRVGQTMSVDSFYNHSPEEWKLWASYGVLAVEMEATALYTLAARYKVNALTILTISDNLVTQKFLSSSERETSFTNMMKLGLSLA